MASSIFSEGVNGDPSTEYFYGAIWFEVELRIFKMDPTTGKRTAVKLTTAEAKFARNTSETIVVYCDDHEFNPTAEKSYPQRWFVYKTPRNPNSEYVLWFLPSVKGMFGGDDSRVPTASKKTYGLIASTLRGGKYPSPEVIQLFPDLESCRTAWAEAVGFFLISDEAKAIASALYEGCLQTVGVGVLEAPTDAQGVQATELLRAMLVAEQANVNSPLFKLDPDKVIESLSSVEEMQL